MTLTSHITSLLYSALYIGKLPFISTNQKIQKWLIVTPVAQFPKGHMIKCIAQFCQSLSELKRSIHWYYFTKLSNICHHDLLKVLKHSIRIDRLINMTFEKQYQTGVRIPYKTLTSQSQMSRPHLAEHQCPIQTKHSQIL